MYMRPPMQSMNRPTIGASSIENPYSMPLIHAALVTFVCHYKKMSEVKFGTSLFLATVSHVVGVSDRYAIKLKANERQEIKGNRSMGCKTMTKQIC